MAYWWTIKTGPVSGVKLYSKTPPKRSQLTYSPFQGAFADLEDEVAGLSADDGLEDAVNEIACRFRELGESQEESLSNMPEGLQQGDTGQLLETRRDRCYEIADELEAIAWLDRESDVKETEDAESADAEDVENDYWQGKVDEVQAVDLSTD